MYCDRCGKYPATTHIKTVINGKMTEENLCDHCAGESVGTFSAEDPFENLFSSLFWETPQRVTAAETCPGCGCSFEEIRAGGKLGCPTCYKTFYHRLLPYIKRVHGNDRHCGMTPGIMPESKPETAKEDLRELLQKAIGEERYEDAARIRDEIKRTEGGAAQ